MELEFFSREHLEREMPYSFSYLFKLDEKLATEGKEVIIKEHIFKQGELEILTNPLCGEIKRTIAHHLSSHCCYCGSTEEVKPCNFDTRNSYLQCNTFCISCRRKIKSINSLFEGIDAFIKFCLKEQKTDKSFQIPNFNLQIRDKKGKMRIVPASNLRLNDSGSILLKENNKFKALLTNNTIEIIGVETEVQDFKGESLYTGNYVEAINLMGKRIKGMLTPEFSLPYRSNSYKIEAFDQDSIFGSISGKCPSSDCVIIGNHPQTRYPVILCQEICSTHRP